MLPVEGVHPPAGYVLNPHSQNAEKNALLALPTGFIQYIFSFIDQPKDFRATLLICKKFYHIMTDLFVYFDVDEDTLSGLLFRAIRTNSLSGVKRLLSQGCIELYKPLEVETTGETYRTSFTLFSEALWQSLESGNSQILCTLLSYQDVSPLKDDSQRETLIDLIEKQFELACEFLENDSRVTEDNLDRLLYCIVEEDFLSDNLIKFLSKIFGHPRFNPNFSEYETLFFAIRNKKWEVVYLWLEHPSFETTLAFHYMLETPDELLKTSLLRRPEGKELVIRWVEKKNNICFLKDQFIKQGISFEQFAEYMLKNFPSSHVSSIGG